MRPLYKIKSYYQEVTPESAEHGDFSDHGEHDITTVDSLREAIDYLERKGYLEPSSSNFHSNIWYTTADSEQDPRTCTSTNYTFHLEGFSKKQQHKIFKALKEYRG